MICLITLPVLAIMALFSATHRQLFFEALDCVFRKTTLRKCQSGLDERLKTKISGALISRNQRIGNFVLKRFEILSFIFMVLMLLSLIFSAQGVYNYIKHGNCNGVDSQEFCILNLGEEKGINCDSENCAEDGCDKYTKCNGDCNCSEGVCE